MDKSCDYCEGALAPLYMISTNGSPTFKMFEPPYCPMCGRPLKQEQEDSNG